jgi:hypothetical protein
LKKLVLGIALVIPIFILILLYFFGSNTYQIRNAQNVSEGCSLQLTSKLNAEIGVFFHSSDTLQELRHQFMTRVCDALPVSDRISFYSNQNNKQSAGQCVFQSSDVGLACGNLDAFFLVDVHGFSKAYPFTSVYLDTLIIDAKVLLKK